MREFFESLDINFYVPKLNVIQHFLNNVDKEKTSTATASSAQYLEGISKFTEKCNLFVIWIKKL